MTLNGTFHIVCGQIKLGLRFQRNAIGFCSRSAIYLGGKNNTFFQVNSLSTQHNLVLLQHRYSAPVSRASPLPQGFRCPLTSAPFGHDHQRRRAEQRRLAPGDPTAAPPGHRRHPAGHRPHSVYHAGDRPDREKPGDMIAGIFRPPIIRSFLLLLRG